MWMGWRGGGSEEEERKIREGKDTAIGRGGRGEKIRRGTLAAQTPLGMTSFLILETRCREKADPARANGARAAGQVFLLRIVDG
jgi:hypothetical protein